MENKNSHIDDFFEKQLCQLEGMADNVAMEAIFKHLDHTEHPIDFALNKGLSDYAIEPTSLSFSDNLGSDLPIIDLALYRQLKAYEATPDKAFNFEPVRKKRRFLWLFFLFVTAAGIGTLSWFNKEKTPAKDVITETNSAENQIRQQSTVTIESNKKQKLNISDKVIAKNRNKQSAYINLPEEIIVFKENRESNIIEDDASEKHLGLINLVPFKSQLNFEALLNVPLKTRPYGPIYKVAPFSFILQTGAISEIGCGNTILNENQHKDAETLFNESTGRYRTGKNYSLSIDYKIGSKIKINTGVVYSSSSNTSTLDYYYTDIPVYDSVGVLRGYLTRPPSSSNHTEAEVKNNSQSIAIPISVQYNLIQLRKMGIWLGAGFQFAMQRQINGQYFDFKTEQMMTSNQNFSRGILPQMSIGFRYPITDKWQLTSQFQMSRQQLTFNLKESSFRRVELIPSMNIGLIFTPQLHIK